MPTYSYKGYDFEVDHQPSAEEFQQMSAYVDSLPPKEARPSKADQALEQVRKDTLASTEGGLEAVKSLLTGAAAQVAAPLVGGVQKVRSELAGVPTTFEKEYADAIQRMTYEPTSEKGKEIMGNVGEAINRYVLPVAPMLGVTGVGQMRAPKGKVGPTPELLAKEVPEAVKTGTEALLEDLNTPVAPEAKKAPGTPMQNMVEQLTGEPYPEATPFNPVMGQMAEQLPSFELESRARPVQETLDARQKQMEFEVKRQTSLDMGAARRAREEAAPTGYREWVEQRDAENLAKRQAIDSELAKRAGSGEQANVFEPHTNMHRAYTEFFAGTDEGVRPFSPTEFREILENLSKEEGTAFQMPEDFSAAYKDYLNHAKEGQGDLFGAHEVLQETSHKAWGELTPQEKAKATRALKKIGPITESMQERMLKNLEEQEGGITHLRSGFTKEDVQRAWQRVGMEFENVKQALNSVDIHKQDVYTEVAKDIQMYLDTGMPSMLHFAGQELKAAGYPESVTNAFKEMTKAASEYERIKKTAEMPFELRKTYNLQRQVSDTARRLRSEAEQIYNQFGDKKYRELSRAEKKLAKEASEKEADANWIGSRTGLSPFEIFDRDWSQVDLRDIESSAQFFDSAAETAAKEFLEKWNPSEKNSTVTYLRSGFTKEDMLNKIPGISLRDVGHAMITSPEQAIELAKNSPDVSQGGLGKAMNTLTKGGIFLSAKLKNPVVSFSVDKLLQADSMARAKISDNVHKVYAESLRSLTKEELLEAKSLLDAADMNQRPITPDMMAKYGLSTNLRDFLGVHQLLMEDVLKSINEARVAVGKKPITPRVAYSAMSMTGDFRQVVTVNGETVGVIGANATKSLERLRDKVLAKFPQAEFSKVQDMTTVQKGGKGSPQAAFMDVLDMVGQDNPAIQEFLNVLNQIAKDDASNYMGMQKHSMQKKGVWGMEGRKWWESEETNAKDFFSNQVRYAESAYQWGELAKAAKEVNEVIRNPEVVGKQNNAVRIVEEYMQNAMGINPSRVGRAVNEFMNSAFGAVGIGPAVPRAVVSSARAVANTMMLSLSPVFLAMQVIQMPAVMPAMSAFLRGRGAAPMSTMLTQGFGHLTEGGWTLTKYLLGEKLTPIEQGAIDYAKKHHVYATDMVEHANQVQKGVSYYTTKLTQSPAAVVEQATRAQVYMAIVHMMKDAGITPKTGLYEQAHRFTDMGMVNYSALEKPAIYNSLGPIGSLAYNLKSFTHNELSRWSMYAREVSETKNPTPILMQMATTIAVAGVFGLPFYSQFEQLYDFITRKLGKPRSLTLDVMEVSKQMGKNLGPKGQFALSNGAPTMLGVDLSTRLGLGDVIPTSAADAAFAGGGKLLEMGKAAGRAVISPTEANLKSAAINLAPPVAQGPMDVAWYQKGNLAMSKNPEKPAKAMARRDATDILLKKIGLTGINESAQKQRVYQQDQLDRAYAAYRTDAMNAISWELVNGKQPSQANLDKYFKTGQGDPQTFIRDIEHIVLSQHMSPEEAIALRQAASQRVPQIQSFLRRSQ